LKVEQLEKKKSPMRFSKRMIFIPLIVGLVILGFILFITLGSAKVTVFPKTQDVNFKLKVTTATTATEVNTDFNRIPGQQFSVQKEVTGSYPSTTQKEVAQNIIAGAGDLSVLAISVQLYGEPSIVKIAPAKSFYPQPQVDSAILKIKLFYKPRFQIGDEKQFFKVVKACFAGKRKQLHNTLTNNLKLPKEKVLEVLSQLKIAPSVRPQELTIEQWVQLSSKLQIPNNK
jgi:hypothetical protein